MVWIREIFSLIAYLVAIAVALLNHRDFGGPKHFSGLSFIHVRLWQPHRKSAEIHDIIVQATFYLVVAYHAQCSRHSHSTHTPTEATSSRVD